MTTEPSAAPPTPPAPAPARPRVPETTPSAADTAALAASWALPLVALVAKLMQPGWIVVFLIVGSPLVLGVLAGGIASFAATFRRRSRVRAEHGSVRRAHHVLAWSWGAAWVVAALVVAEGGDSGPWSSILLTMLGATPPDWYTDVQGNVVLVCVVVACVLPFVNRNLHNRGLHRPDEVTPPGRAPGR